MNSLKLSKRVIGIALSVLFVNAALADATSDARIQAYKANKLIPENVVLPTSTGAADSDEVVLFNKGALSWSSTSALSASYAPLLEKYGDMTVDELRAAMGPAGTFDEMLWEWVEEGWLSHVTPEQQEIREYLSLIANNKLQSDKLTSSEALSYLQEQFDLFVNHKDCATMGAFPCEGLNFSNRDLANVDMSSWKGVTAEQILSSSDLSSSTLPNVAFTGSEDFTGMCFHGTNLSGCTGITGEQIISAGELESATLPAIAFTGEEDFSGLYLYGTDFSNCSGITGKQFLDAAVMPEVNLPQIVFTGEEDFTGKTLPYDVTMFVGIKPSQIAQLDGLSYGMSMTSQQYTEWYDALVAKFSGHTVWVENMYIDVGEPLP